MVRMSDRGFGDGSGNRSGDIGDGGLDRDDGGGIFGGKMSQYGRGE